MADGIMGLFSTPQEIVKAQQLAEQKSFNEAMASDNPFMQGMAMGNRIGAGIGGMMGIMSPEEKKAHELQAMAGSGAYDFNTSAGLASFAKDLNGLGYTKEALQVMEKFNTMLDRERRMAAEDEVAAQGVKPRVEEKTVWIPRTTSKGKPVLDDNGDPIFEPKTIKTYWDWKGKDTGWVKRGDNAAASEGGDMKIHDQASFDAYLAKRYGGQP